MNRLTNYAFIISILFLISRQTSTKTANWQTIFDGETLNGWQKAGENTESISVENGAIKCAGAR